MFVLRASQNIVLCSLLHGSCTHFPKTIISADAFKPCRHFCYFMVNLSDFCENRIEDVLLTINDRCFLVPQTNLYLCRDLTSIIVIFFWNTHRQSILNGVHCSIKFFNTEVSVYFIYFTHINYIKRDYFQLLYVIKLIW